MGLSQREKGKRGERDAAKQLAAILGCDARRGCQFAGGPHSPDIIAIDGLHVEVKRAEKLNLYDAVSQSNEEAGDNVPIVMHRRNHKPWLITLLAADLGRLMRLGEHAISPVVDAESGQSSFVAPSCAKIATST